MVNLTAQAKAQSTIEGLLGQYIGLRVNALGASRLSDCIAHAMAAAGFSERGDYLHHLKTSPAALAALVESVVVPETSLFRNPASFDYLRQYILSARAEKPATHVWRILSLPCSTGEEPYSIAMTCLEAGLARQHFKVEGMDISAGAIAKARQARFSKYSFRRTSQASKASPGSVNPPVSQTPARTFQPHEYYTQKYFQKQQTYYQLCPEVRAQVVFSQGNLADPFCLQHRPPYDIIFCRNLLIYLHPTARQHALQTLDRLLVPNGLLFVGYAEFSQIDPQRFKAVPTMHAFAYQKRSVPQAKASPLLSSGCARPRLSDVLLANARRFKTPSQPPTPPMATGKAPQRTLAVPDGAHQEVDNDALAIGSISPSSSDLLRLPAIRGLADRGKLRQAQSKCDRYLQQHPTSAAAYLLLGEILQAQDKFPLADQAFQKAIYLDPQCVAALAHRLHLCERAGDVLTAQRLRARLQRLQSQNNS